MTVFEELGKLEANKNVIPADCMTFSEAASYVIEYTNSEYNRLFEAIGIEELAVYESTGVQVIYEEGKLNDLKVKVLNFIKRVWQAIKDFFTKVIGFFMSKIKDGAKLKSVNKADAEKYIADDKKFGVVSDWKKNDLLNNKNTGVEDLTKNLNNVVAAMKALAGDYFNDDKSFKDGKDASGLAEAANKIIEEHEQKAYSDILGKSEKIENIGKFRKAYKDKFVVNKSIEVGKKWLVDNIDELVKVVTDKTILENIKSLYNDVKKVTDQVIKNISETYKDSKNAGIAQYSTKAVGNIMKIAQAMSGVYGDLARKYYTESLVLVVRAYSAIAAGKKKAEKEGKKEDEKPAEKKEEKPAEKKEEKVAADESVAFVDEAFNW